MVSRCHRNVGEPVVDVGELALAAGLDVSDPDVAGVGRAGGYERDGSPGRIQAGFEAGSFAAEQDAMIAAARFCVAEGAVAAVGDAEVDAVGGRRPEQRGRSGAARVVRADSTAQAAIPAGRQLDRCRAALGWAAEEPAVQVGLLAVPWAEIGDLLAGRAPGQRDSWPG